MADVLMFDTVDGGEIEVAAGVVTMHDALEVATYLSLFGGSAEDRGTPATVQKQWWGNLVETEPMRACRGETQAILENAPITTATARDVESAARRDLAWMLDDELATSVDAKATIPGVNKLHLRIVVVVANGERHEFTFTRSR